MSTRKRPLPDLAHPTNITPSRRKSTSRPLLPTTPSINSNPYITNTGTRLRSRSARTLRQLDPNSVRPNSARGILRRLAKITAANTTRRVPTPQHDKENILPEADYNEKALVKPRSRFELEESLGEDDSEILIAPTPSGLADDTDDDDEDQPTITFLRDLETANATRVPNKRRSSVLPQPGPEDDEGEDEDEGQTTFLTERGRRAVSEEPTRMSRYSFGSLRMSDFGTELEISRHSDRQKKQAELEGEDDYGRFDIDLSHHIPFGGETEDLRNLRPSSPQAPEVEDETVEVPGMAEDTFQLDLPDEDEQVVDAHQRATAGPRPQIADTILQEGDEDQIRADPSEQPSRRQTLLESITAKTAATRRRKRAKLNSHGNMVPAVPSSLIKRIIHDSQEEANKRKTALGKDHMKALEQATEWFFEQASEDLAAYSSHGRRKKRIDADDVLLLMRRQRVLRNDGDLLKMAKDWLPREMLKDLDLPDRP